MKDLEQWLQTNHIQYTIEDADVIKLPGFGRCFVQDMSSVNSIFRKNKEGDIEFNCMEQPDILMAEGINYVVLQFGDCWYYIDLRQDFKLEILKYIGKRTSIQSRVKFVNLGVHTPFELLNGSFMPDMWVRKACWEGHTALGICDRNTMAAQFMFQKECEAAEITPILGYTLTFEYGDSKVGARIYAQTQQGFRNMLRIQKTIMVDLDSHIIPVETLLKYAAGNAIVLDKYSAEWQYNYPYIVSRIVESFDRSYYQVDINEYKAERIDIKVLESTKFYFDNLYKKSGLAPILLSDCYYLDKDDAKNKIILNKIAEGAAHEQSDEQYFKSIDEHYQQFVQLFDSEKWDIDLLFSECCANTLEIAEHATARVPHGKSYMPEYAMTDEEAAKYGDTHNMFCQLLEDGLKRLAPPERIEEYRKQMEYERYIIESTNNVDYLLVQYDTVNWCRKNDILVGCGRGSAAGSLLLYLLGITLIDPLKYNLIFERFLLPERAGLYQAKTAIIGEDILSRDYVEVDFGERCVKLDVDAQLMVRRNNDTIQIYADELQAGDDILFDNKDELFTIKEL